ncbi:MAG TPA: S-adenosylmethionine:tRNA ribosyltransferase-isomerase [Salinivirgaceae bacterium]|nr:S-adenosylmethionine:tRNA ribosyltransferase-isomerase [Salinivirgaceae bacterium]HQA75641.1 S-adenosylmethionine:tRNA ribosyltransferase-isomerase [Salinivirgaceae bacterium]
MHRLSNLDINQFDYELPNDRIAKYPLKNRDESKLLLYNKGVISEETFKNLPQFLPKNSLLVFNNTKVISARLFFRNSNGAKIEIFCLEPAFNLDFSQAFASTEKCRWNCLVGNLKRWKGGTIISEVKIDGEQICLEAELIEKCEGHNIIEFRWSGKQTFGELLDHAGKIPIPPYLNRESEEEDKLTYQTIFGKVLGSVAAPTAGLHFTDTVLQSLKEREIFFDELTLHVGAGTFRAMSGETIHDHTMHSEFFTLSKETIKNLKQHIGNITAVGTTTTRTLESLYYIGCQLLSRQTPANNHFNIEQWEPYEKEILYSVNESVDAVLEYLETNKLTHIQASTSIIIVPGYKYKLTNRLITNFHQPKSTLLLLLASFVGENWKQMYSFALERNFRFLSYGDCCLII